MTAAADSLASGKGHRDENFPVASFLLKPEHRAPVMAFYRFARGADDVADHPDAPPEEKLRLLGAMRATLSGQSDADPASATLRAVMAERRIDPAHAHDLLTAFERDVTVNRYADWDSLIDYCRYSAMPVGRFVLDVHGEARSTWPASDALCAALQVINHLQDCGKDYRMLDRVYIPNESFRAAGAQVNDLGADRATPTLRSAIGDLAGKTMRLLDQSSVFAGMIRDRRLGIEVAIIQKLAVSLTRRLQTRDPLSERVHHSAPETIGLALSATLGQVMRGRR